MPTEGKLIQFGWQFKHPVARAVTASASRPVSQLLGIDQINSIYERLRRSRSSGQPFGNILKLLDVSYLVQSEDLTRIPTEGPLVVVANHPFGGIEGMVLGDLIQRIRPDTKIVGNFLLNKIAPIRESLISVDPFGRSSSIRTNAAQIRECLRWLKAGHGLIVFPAGEVAHYCHHHRCITDPPWSVHVAALVRLSGAQVSPIFFDGRNSILFNLLGIIHPKLRTAMLGRELLAKKASRVTLTIGRAINSKRMSAFPSDRALIRWLRFKTYFLASCAQKMQVRPRLSPKRRVVSSPELKQLTEPVPPALLAAEVATLPESNRLVKLKQFSVFIAGSQRIPHLLREIGRLREKTFREVGEGTGRSSDIDLFDSYYRHLILWNEETSEVVGAYRMGDVHAIIDRFGRKGLYAHSLFRFKGRLVQYLDNALELGRSFIRTKYQRQPNCLSLLWKGIGAYLVRHPEYRILYGPVSISNSYHRVSKRIMVQFLMQNCANKELSAYVNPRHPFRPSADRRIPDIWEELPAETIDNVSMLVAEIEDDGKRVPILIKHYLKLNGQFIAFNVDRKFADAIDGLVVVDLLKTAPKLLDRFMGKAGRRAYLGYWSIAAQPVRWR
jgi:putative hemolysin